MQSSVSEPVPQKWEMVTGHCLTEGAEICFAYGVRAVFADGRAWEFPDVSVHTAEVWPLLQKLDRESIEPCHWKDVVEDYIQTLTQG